MNFVQADAAHLPFRNHCFAAIILNHSLEHFINLAPALREMGRVSSPAGAMFVAVPDSSTLSDRLYRWLGRGGGHVNAFTSAADVAAVVEHATGLRHVATRTLCTSLSFLNRRNIPDGRLPRRAWLVGGGNETILRFATYLFRKFDRCFGTRTSIYGWAFYFGKVAQNPDPLAWTNVCIRCGSGHPSAWLRRQPSYRHSLFLSSYSCPNCGARNLYTSDASSSRP